MSISKKCDRCGRQLSFHHDRIVDQIQADYPGKDICQNCDFEIKLVAVVAERAALGKRSEREVLEEWLKNYEE